MEKIQTKNFVIYFLLSCTIITVFMWIILVWHENRITEFVYSENQLADSSQFSFNIDNVNYRKDDLPTTKDYIEVSGWMVKPDEEIKSASIQILLKNMDTNECYLLPTTIIERTDITSYFFDEYYQYNFDQSGFLVKIPQTNNINTDNHDYEIMALYTLNGSEYIVSLNTSIKTWEERYHTLMTEDDFVIVNSDEYNFSIDRMKYKEELIQIEGWAVLYGCDPTDADISVVLQDNITEKFYKTATSKVERPDVKDIYNDGIDYTQAGFSMSIKQDSVINLDYNYTEQKYNNDYYIYIMYSKNNINYLIPTGTSIRSWKEQNDEK